MHGLRAFVGLFFVADFLLLNDPDLCLSSKCFLGFGVSKTNMHVCVIIRVSLVLITLHSFVSLLLEIWRMHHC